MRTTLNLDEHLIREAKALAAREGRTLTSVVEEALRGVIAQRQNDELSEQRFEVEAFGGGGLQPGVELDDSAALLDIMESR